MSHDDLTIIGSCSGQLEAGVLREYLEAHGVVTHIQGEHHNALFGSFGSIAIALNIMVRESDRDLALELIAVFRAEFEDSAPAFDHDADDGDVREHGPGLMHVGKRPRTAMILSLVPSFGMGHFYAGAFARGLVLAATEILGIGVMSTEYTVLGVGLAVPAVLVDFLGSSSLIAERASQGRRAEDSGHEQADRAASDELPEARLLK